MEKDGLAEQTDFSGLASGGHGLPAACAAVMLAACCGIDGKVGA
jgi:hypothetical protein